MIECSDNLNESYVTTVALPYGPASALIELEETINFGPIKVAYTPPAL